MTYCTGKDGTRVCTLQKDCMRYKSKIEKGDKYYPYAPMFTTTQCEVFIEKVKIEDDPQVEYLRNIFGMK